MGLFVKLVHVYRPMRLYLGHRAYAPLSGVHIYARERGIKQPFFNDSINIALVSMCVENLLGSG